MQHPLDLPAWEARCRAFLEAQITDLAAHGLDHIRRVVATARRLAAAEHARLEVVLPAAWLHDCVVTEKNAPDRAQASTRAAERAQRFLAAHGYPRPLLRDVYHAIQAHSFSAGIVPETPEARVVQDADRLDALGAVGLARCLTVGGRLGLPLYHEQDPFCKTRPPDDRRFILDHFYAKLFTLPDTMQTDAGRREALRRVRFLESFLKVLATELPPAG